MRAEIYLDAGEQWRFRLIAGNNEIVAQSECYKTKQSARKTLNSIFRELKAQNRLSITLPDELKSDG